jgi:hypothetical protein
MDEEEEEETEAEMEVDSDSDSDSDSDGWEVVDRVGEGAEQVVVQEHRRTHKIITGYDDTIYGFHTTKNNDTFGKLHHLGSVNELYALNKARFKSIKKNSRFGRGANILFKKKFRQQ